MSLSKEKRIELDRMLEVRTTVRKLLTANLSVVPLLKNGEKKPAIKWKHLQERPMLLAEIAECFQQSHGIAIVCGKVSRNLEVLDFDDDATAKAWQAALSPDATAILKTLPIVLSARRPKPGVHIYYRCYARAEKKEDLAKSEDGKAICELKTDGCYVVSPFHSRGVHPNGNEYRLVNGCLFNVPNIPIEVRNEFLEVARKLNKYEPQKIVKPWQPQQQVAATSGNDEFSKAKNAWESSRSWQDILHPFGWRHSGQSGRGDTFTRPDKPHGVSGIAYWTDGLFHCFSSSAQPMESGHQYSKWWAYAILKYGPSGNGIRKEIMEWYRANHTAEKAA